MFVKKKATFEKHYKKTSLIKFWEKMNLVLSIKNKDIGEKGLMCEYLVGLIYFDNTCGTQFSDY